MRDLARHAIALLFLLILAGPVHADTIIVQQDGSGDATTIGAALAQAAAGDSILVGPGTYAESVTVDKPLHVASIMGPDQTILDGQDAMRMLWFDHTGVSSLTGFRLVNGYSDSGGALLLFYATLTVRDCVFEDNYGGYQGGAMSCGEGCTLTVVDCVFRDNYATEHAGAVLVIQWSTSKFGDCVFVGNRTDVSAGAIAAHSSVMDVSGCLFCRNLSDDIAGAIYLYASTGRIESNTFYDNTSPGHATVAIHESVGTTVERNILACETNGFALKYIDCFGAHACNVYWDNADGPICPPGLADDEIVADPMFCEPWQDNFMIYDISPAAPEHSPCGLLVGAFPVGCTGTATRDATWGAIKAIY